MKQTTAVKVFNELQEKAGIYTFFRDGRLVCGKIYSDEKVSRLSRCLNTARILLITTCNIFSRMKQR
jgi:ketopantoate reductase